MSEQQSYNMANTWKAPRAMRYLASRLLREWQDAIESDPALRRYRIMVKRYEKEFEATVREFDKEHSESVGDARCGDAAKQREALSKFCAYSAVVLNTGMFNRVHLEALLNMAKAALAAPPRNCDRFCGPLAYWESLDVYIKEEESPVAEDGEDNPPLSFEEALERMNKYRQWLFALAATDKMKGEKQ